MTKLYYTDPLKAAWMAREFNVKLDPVAGQNIYYNEEHVLFYVPPSSLSIFEPMEGDVMDDGETLFRFIWIADGYLFPNAKTSNATEKHSLCQRWKMVDIIDDEYNDFQLQWVDYIDNCDNPVDEIDGAINKLKLSSTHPWLHPNKNMAWLWDWLLNRRAELLMIGGMHEQKN